VTAPAGAPAGAAGALGAVAAPGGAGRRARLRACTLLLVDDEPANLDLLEALLEAEGYGEAGGGRLVRTTDAREVEALSAAHPPDLVLLDLHMPHRHGLAVLADLRAAAPPDEYRPVLVLTADVTGEAKEYALALGARDFVTKPFDAGEVLLRVENLLDARVLHADERRARERAEAAEARASLLAEWSRLLGGSLDPATALEYLPRLLVPRWAAACAAALGGAAAREAAVAALGPGALAAPIVTDDGPAGVLALVPAAGGADRALVDELAARAGQAAEHARLLAPPSWPPGSASGCWPSVAHDLRNPLGAVAMYAEVLAGLPARRARTARPPTPTAAPRSPPSTRARRACSAWWRTCSTPRRCAAARSACTARRPPRARCSTAAERVLRPLAEGAGLSLAVEPEGGAAGAVVPLDAARVGPAPVQPRGQRRQVHAAPAGA
jgi:CheY-like chemotaxis protein